MSARTELTERGHVATSFRPHLTDHREIPSPLAASRSSILRHCAEGTRTLDTGGIVGLGVRFPPENARLSPLPLSLSLLLFCVRSNFAAKRPRYAYNLERCNRSSRKLLSVISESNNREFNRFRKLWISLADLCTQDAGLSSFTSDSTWKIERYAIILMSFDISYYF